MMKLIVSDVDGTLIPEGTQEYDLELLDIIEELKKKGILFCAASGRQCANLQGLFREQSDDMLFIGENGGVVIYKDEVLDHIELSEQLIQNMIEAEERMEGLHLLVSGIRKLYISAKGPQYYKDMPIFQASDVVEVEDYSDIPETITKLSFWVDQRVCDIDEAKKELEGLCGEDFFVANGGNSWLDLIAHFAGKGKALATYMEKHGIGPEELMVFGDNDNDCTMLALTPNSYAMAGSSDHVKSFAGHVCDDVCKVLKDFLKTME